MLEALRHRTAVRRLAGAVLVALGAMAPAGAQPYAFYQSVLNAASFAPQAAAHGAIARGAIFTIFGRGLGPAEGVSVSAFPLAETLAGVSIEVCQGGTCIPAYPLFVRADQVNAVMPSTAPLGRVSMRVTFAGAAGNFTPAEVVRSSFGIFAVNSGGFGPGIVQNFVASGDTPLNSLATTARPGQAMILWGTGLGAAPHADNVPAPAGELPTPVEIWVGGQAVTVKRYSGRAPGFAGLDQIVFDLPADTPTGCYVPVTMRTGGVVSNTVTIAVTADGAGECADPANPLDGLRRGGRSGLVVLTRTLWRSPLPVGFAVTVDGAGARFQEAPSGPWRFDRLSSLPPPGACTTYTFHAGAPDFGFAADAIRSGPALSAGAELAFAGSGGAPRTADSGIRPGFYTAYLGTDVVFDPPLPLFFGASPAARVSAAGGSEVGAFSVDVPAPAPFEWSNRQGARRIRAGEPLTVEWTGGDAAGTVLIGGFSRAAAEAATAGFVCAAAAAGGSFVVPPEATSALVKATAGATTGSVVVAALPSVAAPFSAPGLDLGLALFAAAEREAALVE
ncbi:MAG: hypothetical protein IPM24_09750 [Bryobacterales bacterium]|nr:hypothetical protein [Bryobacterales bacterium]